jgi:hypothetical protein
VPENTIPDPFEGVSIAETCREGQVTREREETYRMPLSEKLTCRCHWLEPDDPAKSMFGRIVAAFSRSDVKSIQDQIAIIYPAGGPLRWTKKPDRDFRKRLAEYIKDDWCTQEQGYENVYSVREYLNNVAAEEIDEKRVKEAQDSHIAGVPEVLETPDGFSTQS